MLSRLSGLKMPRWLLQQQHLRLIRLLQLHQQPIQQEQQQLIQPQHLHQ